jgi:hypothetical protein
VTEPNLIADETAFVSALGLNPATIVKGTLRLEFEEGRPVLRVQHAYIVPPHVLGMAFMAAAGDTGSEPEQPPAPEEAPSAEDV